MSYFIANTIKFNSEDNKIYIKGGCNNIVPRYNEWTHYDKKENLLIDLISGSLKLNSKNTLAKKCKEAITIIESNWHKQFSERNEIFGEHLPINPYSLFMISQYKKEYKEKYLKSAFDLSRISENYKERHLREAESIKDVYDEGEKFFNEQIDIFFNHIGISKNN
jgi:hypothetical protein